MLFFALRNLCNFDQMLIHRAISSLLHWVDQKLIFRHCKSRYKNRNAIIREVSDEKKNVAKPVITTEIYSYTQRDALILEKEAVLKEKGEAKEETVLSKEKAIKEKEYLRQNEEERARKVKQDRAETHVSDWLESKAEETAPSLILLYYLVSH